MLMGEKPSHECPCFSSALYKNERLKAGNLMLMGEQPPHECIWLFSTCYKHSAVLGAMDSNGGAALTNAHVSVQHATKMKD